MRTATVLSACATVALLACTSENGPAEPEASGAMTPAAPTVAAAVDIWRERGPHRFGTVIGPSVGVLANPAGQSVVYGFGGCDVVQGGFGECTVEQISIYNAATDTWTFDRSFYVSVWSSNGVGTIGGKLYSSGGYNVHQAGDNSPSRRVWAYDPAARRVTQRADMPKKTAEGVTGVISDKLYVLPGTCDANLWPQPGSCPSEPIRRLYRYDPATNKWVARKSAPHYHRSGAGGVIGGKFYVVGGFHGWQPVADLDVYDPATDTWKTLAPIPSAGGAVGTALGGRLYVLVGTNAYVYNPGTNRWSPIAKPTWGHDGVVRVVINGKPKLLAVGGLHGPNFDIPNDTEVYTP
jgi:N-acetylneuraminic acid mutarotase